jgi:hypothetical protein
MNKKEEKELLIFLKAKFGYLSSRLPKDNTFLCFYNGCFDRARFFLDYDGNTYCPFHANHLLNKKSTN